MEKLVELLRQKQLTLSAMESITGGLFSKRVTDCPGASTVFKGSLVSYTNNIKERLGRVDHDLIVQYTAVSQAVSEAMAQQCLQLFQTDVAISFTGNAGPSPSESKPVGLVYMSICYHKKTYSFEMRLTGNREEIRNQVVQRAMQALIEIIEGETDGER